MHSRPHFSFVTGNAYAQSTSLFLCDWQRICAVDPWQFVSFLLWLAAHMHSWPTMIWRFSFVTGNTYAQSTVVFFCDWQRICTVDPCQFGGFLLWLATHMHSWPMPIWWLSFVTGNAYAQSTHYNLSAFFCDKQCKCTVSLKENESVTTYVCFRDIRFICSPTPGNLDGWKGIREASWPAAFFHCAWWNVFLCLMLWRYVMVPPTSKRANKQSSLNIDNANNPKSL